MIKTEAFGVLPGGQPVNQYILTNETGVTVKILNYGGIIREILTPDRNGILGNIVLSYEALEDYMVNPAYIGAAIGRTGGRIGGGQLTVGDSVYSLPQNDGANTLHGGPSGFHHKYMDAVLAETADAIALSLSFTSEAGECGYPGKLALELRYTLMKRENRLKLDFLGRSDAKTYLNMTHHGYFNLSGSDGTIEDHTVQLSADAYAPITEALLPQEGWVPVADSPFDMRDSHVLKAVIHAENEQIQLAGGLDHPFRLHPTMGEGLNAPCVWLKNPKTGRCLSVSTTQKCMVVYTGNNLDKAEVPSGKRFSRYQGICFEAQEAPNATENPAFECTYLEPKEIYHHGIMFDFSSFISPLSVEG